MSLDQLPLELVNYIKSYAIDMIEYSYYSTLKWDEIYIFLNNLCNEHMIGKIDDALNVDDFKRMKWLYHDYLKMYPGKMWFWNDECTDYEKYIDTLIDYLFEFNKNPYDNLQQLNKVNKVYSFIISHGEKGKRRM